MNLKFGPVKVHSIGMGAGIAFLMFLVFLLLIAVSFLICSGFAWLLLLLINVFVAVPITTKTIFAGGAIIFILVGLFKN